MYASLRTHTETTLKAGREELKQWEKELKVIVSIVVVIEDSEH